MHRAVETVLLAALAGLTWVLVVLLGGMLLAVAAGPSVIGLVQLGLTGVLVYPVVPLYRSITEASTLREGVDDFGGRAELAVAGAIFLLAIQPVVFSGEAIVGFPLFNAPSMLYPAVVEVRALLGGWTAGVLSVAVLWLQAVWAYLLADAGYDAVTAVFKRRRHEG